jgi:hypothetical protein
MGESLSVGATFGYFASSRGLGCDIRLPVLNIKDIIYSLGRGVPSSLIPMKMVGC